MREEEAAEARRRAAAAAAEKREAQRREMLAANAEMLRLKARGPLFRRPTAPRLPGAFACAHAPRCLVACALGARAPTKRGRQPLKNARPRASLPPGKRRPQAEREARERAEEEAFRAAAMARFAEDDRLEQMNAQRRRLRVQVRARRFWLAGGWVDGWVGGYVKRWGSRWRRCVRSSCLVLLLQGGALPASPAAGGPFFLRTRLCRPPSPRAARARLRSTSARWTIWWRSGARCSRRRARQRRRRRTPSARGGRASGGRRLRGGRLRAASQPGEQSTAGARCCPTNTPACPLNNARRAEAERRAGIIEAERRRLLAQAADLQGFLPRGVLRGEEDAQLLRTAGAARGAGGASGAAAASGERRAAALRV